MPRISVLIADQYSVVRAGIESVLARAGSFRVVGACGDGRDMLRQVNRLGPEVLITDIPLPRLNGLEAAQQISLLPKRPRVVIFSELDGSYEVELAMRAKVTGYLVKSSAIERVPEAVRAAAEGRGVFSPSVERHLKFWGKCPEFGKKQPEGLTSREVEVAQLVTENHSDKEISDILGVSTSRVKHLVESIADKLGVKGRLGIAYFGFRTGKGRVR